MKKHFLRLFEPANRRLTVSFSIAGLVFIITAVIIGIADNIPGIVLLYAGLFCLFLAVTHIWKQVKSFGTLAAVCASILAVMVAAISLLSSLNLIPLHNPPTQIDELLGAFVFMLILLVCVPGIIVGIAGMAYRKILQNKSAKKV